MAKEATAKKEDAPKPEAKGSKVTRGVKAKPANDKDGEKAERARKYPENLKIKILNKENPHLEGSGRGNAFAALLNCKTMADYYATGHKIKYIASWIESGHMADFADA